MCRINGHSIFTYRLDNAGWKRFNDKNKAVIAAANKQLAEANKQIEEFNKPQTDDVEGTMPTPIVPITKTTGTGVNNTTPKIGLNL